MDIKEQIKQEERMETIDMLFWLMFAVVLVVLAFFSPIDGLKMMGIMGSFVVPIIAIIKITDWITYRIW